MFLFEMQMARIGLASVYASMSATRCRGTVAQLMTASALQQLQQGHRASGSTTWCLIRVGRGGWGCR